MSGARGSRAQSEIDERKRDYYLILFNAINGVWNMPSENLLNNKDLEAVYVVRIARSGQVVKGWFEKQSGESHFDSSVETAVGRCRFPPLPDVFNSDSIEVGFVFYPSGVKRK